MVTKTLRILIVDTCAVQRLAIEKMFNRLGYFGIATTECVEEAWALNQYKSHAFDLLVINVRLLCHPRALALTCPDEAGIEHLLVFGLHDRLGDPVTGVNPRSMIGWMPGVPEHWRMFDFMRRVEHQRSRLPAFETVG